MSGTGNVQSGFTPHQVPPKGGTGGVSPHYSRYLGRLWGFTLLELLIVMALMVILAGMAFPNMRRTVEGLQFRSVAEDFHAVLDRLHERAMWDRKMMVLAIDSGSNQYRYYASDAENSARPVRLPAAVQISSTKDEVLFYPDGSIDAASITLAGVRDQAADFVTQGVFGGIKMQLH